MHHIGTITKSSKNLNLPFHAQCSCGTAGDFSAKESAEAYLQNHHAKQGGISTTELIDKSDEPEVFPVAPLPHAPSVPVAEPEVPAEPVQEEIAETSTEPAPEAETNWKKKKK